MLKNAAFDRKYAIQQARARIFDFEINFSAKFYIELFPTKCNQK